MGNDVNFTVHVKLEWDSDSEENPIEAEAAVIESRLRDQSKRLKQGVLRFDHGDNQGEEQDEDEILSALTEVIDLTGEDANIRPQGKDHPFSKPSLRLDVLLDHYDLGNSKLEPGSTVEIKTLEHSQLYKASFLCIKQIIDTPSGVKLRGIPLTRTKNLRGLLPRLRNEVAKILHVDNEDSDELQAAIEVPITDVVKARNCHFTNADYPQHRTVLGIHKTVADLELHGVLMCRWKIVFKYRDSATRIAHLSQTGRKAAPFEYVIKHLNDKDTIKKRFMVPESGRFNVWRGGKVRGGEHDPENENSPITGPVVPLDSKEDPEQVIIGKKSGQRYTFGDMFCGAGGASCGARKAGFQVKVACDHHAGACKTYSKVYPEAQLYSSDIFDFIIREDLKIRVDVLHLSPPCQYWSPAHTVAGVNDEANIAVLFSCHELIRKIRPRLFTLEQTFGILHPRFEYYFNALIQGFTENNYSVRWKIVDLVDWGSPATRKRLVMIGSCPGEDLPPFPKATHVAPGIKKRGRKPHVTVEKMLARIPYNASLHDDMHRPHEMVRKSLERWDPDVTLKRCITTNGGCGNYHPNGRRDFTLREYATLQTFPVEYPFQKPDIKRQIGNAFPPMTVKVLYTHLRKWLENKDGVYATENEPLDPDDPNVEVLDLEDKFMYDEISDDEDVEYVGSQQLSTPSASTTSTYEEDMDLDMNVDDYSIVPCIDPNQTQRFRRTTQLTTGNITHGYIDLTDDDIW